MADSKDHIAQAVQLVDSAPTLAAAHAQIAQAKSLDLIAAALSLQVSRDRVRV